MVTIVIVLLVCAVAAYVLAKFMTTNNPELAQQVDEAENAVEHAADEVKDVAEEVVKEVKKRVRKPKTDA